MSVRKSLMARRYPRSRSQTDEEDRWPDGATTRSSPSCARSSTRTAGRPCRSPRAPAAVDTVVVEKDGEQRTFSSDHIAFHRFVEGVKEDFGL